MRGERILKEELNGETRHEFRLSNIQHGLYFVKVLANEHVETFKLIITR